MIKTNQTTLLSPTPLKNMKSPKECLVKRLPSSTARRYIIKHHYSHGCNSVPSACYRLFWNGELIGALVFAVSCSENVRASILGTGTEGMVTELHRLHIIDGTPKNTESWFISRCIRSLKTDMPEIKIVISFADPMEGHVGMIYQATNALYYGTSGNATFFVDRCGRVRHPRQSGKNITSSDAAKMGWIPTKRKGKHRYLWILDPAIQKEDLRVVFGKYPKLDDHVDVGEQ
jgi:hypothetical protein